jgi:hypothetical protein
MGNVLADAFEILAERMTATKYVASNTRDSSEWQPTVFLSGDLAEKVGQVKTNGRT